MKIKINVKNSSVDFLGQEINLDRCGVYLMKGPNGIGKTTILKDIVFTRQFDSPNCNHFAYAEQGPRKYNIRINEYLERFHSGVDFELMHTLMEKLDLMHLDMKSSVLSVSGGELEKLNIIACLIKDLEYVFLDEPTNNLDNASVESLVEVIENLARNRVIVVVSHDPRLTFADPHIIEVKQNRIDVSYAKSENNNLKSICEKKNVKYPTGKILRRHFARFSTIANVFLLMIYTFAIIYINHIVFGQFYSPPELTNEDDTILVYSVDMEYGELNQRYAKSLGLKVDEDKYYSVMQYSDISAIASEYDVEDIYIENEVFADYLADIILGRKVPEERMKLSIPQIILENYILQINPYFSTDFLLQGRYPHDGKKEIVVSQEMLDNVYPGKSINDKVLFEGEEYVLVGVHYLDLCILSFDGASEYFYRYDSETYESFIDEQTKYKKEKDAPESYIYKPMTITIQAEGGKEGEILKGLFLEYPANNFYSYTWANDIADYENAKLSKNAWIANMVAVSVLGVLLISIGRKRCEMYDVEAESLDNYYLSKPLTSRILCISELVLNGLLYVLAVIVARSLALYNMEFAIVCVGCSVLFVAASVSHMVRLIKGYE